MNDILLQSESKKAGYFIRWLAILLILMLSSLCFFVALKEGDPHFYATFTGLFLLTLGLFQIYRTGTFHHLDIYQDRLEIKNIFGILKQTIYRNDIKTWMEVDRSMQSKREMELTLYTQEKKYRVLSKRYKNYRSIKNELTKGKERDSELERTFYIKQGRQLGVMLLIMGAFSIYGFFYRYTHKPIMGETSNSSRLCIIAIFAIVLIGFGLFLMRKRKDE